MVVRQEDGYRNFHGIAIPCAVVVLGITGVASTAHAGVNCLQAQYSPANNTLTVKGPGSCTLGQIRRPGIPLELVDGRTLTWKLSCHLVLVDGARLQLYGSAAEGDVDELRLKSSNVPGANPFASITADWGYIDIRSTRITSWDDQVNGPDEEHQTYGRAFIRVRSWLDPDGITPRESRLDIRESDIGYLGYSSAESYGLSWKAVDAREDLARRVGVRGEVLLSRLHHNYRGIYVSGVQGGRYVDNEVDHNVDHGMDAHADSDHLHVELNKVHDNGRHGILLSGDCDQAVLRHNTVYANGGHGIMLHDGSDHAEVMGNEVGGNQEGGLVIHGGQNNLMTMNSIHDNEDGIRITAGASGNTVEDNDIRDQRSYAVDIYKGPEGDDRPRGNVVQRNRILNQPSYTLRLLDADDNVMDGNMMVGNAEHGVLVTNARHNTLSNNILDSRLSLNCQSRGRPSLTVVQHQSHVYAALEPDAEVVVEDDGGLVPVVDAPVVATVSSNGSSVVLTASNTGGRANVRVENLRLSVSSGEIHVTHRKEGRALQSWMVEDTDLNQVMDAVLEGLEPNRPYAVSRIPFPPRVLHADDKGTLRFKDPLLGQAQVIYRVDPVIPSGCASVWPLDATWIPLLLLCRRLNRR